MRLIDADAFGKALEKEWDTNSDSDFANKCVWRVLENAPTIEPEPHWIPCSERLPENNQICLVCGQYGGIRVARVYIPAATEPWNGDPNTNWWTVVGTGKSFNAVAWMPLPEPYAERRTDESD